MPKMEVYSMINKRVFKTFAISCLALMWSLPVYADKEKMDTHSSMVHGILESKYTFNGMTIEQIRTHFAKLNLKLDDLVSQSVVTFEDGVASIRTQLPEATVSLDNQTVEVIDNEFMFHEVTSGNHKLKVYSYDTLVLDKEISIEDGTTHLPLDLKLDINKIVKKAQDKMEPSQESSLTIEDVLFLPQSDSLVTPMSDPDYWNGYYVGQVLGLKKGKMLLLTNQGHVSCNKSYNDKGANFPANNSDCALAVTSGALYYSNPILFSAYSQGAYCVQEAMDSVENPSRANIYCNWVAKPNAAFTHNYLNKGYNCSSFIFLGNDERLTNY